MKKFIVRIILFLAILLFLDRSFIVFRVNETNIFNDIAVEKMKVISHKINEPQKPKILIVGSSHAQFGISPEILGEKLHTSVLNVAYGGGSNIGLQLTLLRKLIEDKGMLPNWVVFGMEFFTLNAQPLSSDGLLPYLFQESESIQGFRNSKMWYSYFRLYSRFIPRYISQAQAGNYVLPYFDKKNSYDLSMFHTFDKYEISPGGWVEGYGALNKEYIRYAETGFHPLQQAQAYLDEYVDLCGKNHIGVIFIEIPEHEVCLEWIQKYRDFDTWMKTYTESRHVAYWNFNRSANFPNGEDSLFFDSDHLNKQGAELFSQMLAEKLKTYTGYQ